MNEQGKTRTGGKHVEFEITGTIDTRGLLKLDKPFGVELVDAQFDAITMSGDGRIDCVFRGSAKTSKMAEKRVMKALDRLADLMVCEFNTPAVPIGITSWNYKDKWGQRLFCDLSFLLDAILSKVVVVDTNKPPMSELARKKFSQECQQMQRRYRQARNEENPGMRYFLLYRILESRLDTKVKIDRWIECRQPGVEKVPDRSRNMHTVYTDVRNQLHPRGAVTLFPYKEVKKYVGKLEELTRKLLAEKCKIAES